MWLREREAFSMTMLPMLYVSFCGDGPIGKHFFLEGLFGLKGLGSSDCHFDLIPGVAFIESAEMLVAGNNGNR